MACMQTIKEILKFIGGVIIAVLAPFVLIVLGALVVGFGIYTDLEWVMNGGMVLAALGVVWIIKGVFGE
jgi:hypothetical protein